MVLKEEGVRNLRGFGRLFFIASGALAALSGLTACEKKAPSEAPDEIPLVARGRTVYQSNCIACHNVNPRVPGSVGPDVWGSSRELLEARIVRAAYPEGYKPKRATHLMPAQPQFKGEVDAIHAFLNSK